MCSWWKCFRNEWKCSTAFLNNKLKRSSEVGITDANMTRFFLTVEDAVGLLFKAVSQGRGGEIFVMKMPACKITDLAEILIEDSKKKILR